MIRLTALLMWLVVAVIQAKQVGNDTKTDDTPRSGMYAIYSRRHNHQCWTRQQLPGLDHMSIVLADCDASQENHRWYITENLFCGGTSKQIHSCYRGGGSAEWYGEFSSPNLYLGSDVFGTDDGCWWVGHDGKIHNQGKGVVQDPAESSQLRMVSESEDHFWTFREFSISDSMKCKWVDK